jgi:hypothetical protein
MCFSLLDDKIHISAGDSRFITDPFVVIAGLIREVGGSGPLHPTIGLWPRVLLR